MYQQENRLKDKRKVYLDIASNFASLSRCERKKVGSIIVKNQNIISSGFNGTISGFNNKCEDENDETLNIVLHSEANAILKCAKQGLSTNEADLYLTFSPCLNCSKLIIQAGIKTVIYLEKHSCTKGLELLEKADILVINYNEFYNEK